MPQMSISIRRPKKIHQRHNPTTATPTKHIIRRIHHKRKTHTNNLITQNIQELFMIRYIVWMCMECGNEIKQKLPTELSDGECPKCGWNPEVDFIRIEEVHEQ